MRLRTLWVACASLLVVACDGANQGVQIGNGQTPDPVVVDFPIAYIRAPIPVDDNGEFEQTDLREQITFDVGSDLYYRDRASPTALDVNITGRFTGGMGAVRDIEIDYDASRLLFSMRGPFDPNLDDEDQPTWNIWQYTFETDELVRVIPSDLTAEIGHDIMPKYLPDGRIIFASTRQVRSQAVLLDEGKPGFVAMDEDDNEYAFTIHVMNDDGSNIEQLTFNQSHDLDPTVLSNGQIVFSRWDNAGPNNAVDLYRMNPDGSQIELLYGKQSHDTGTDGTTIQFTQPRELEDGRILTLIRPFTNTEGGGELITIDTNNYVENTQPVVSNAGGTGPAQADATINEVLTQAGPSPGGRYASAYPIQDGTGRMLVGWSQCRLIEFLADDGDPATDDTRIVPCTDDRLANLVTIDPDNPVTPAEGEFIVAPPLYGIWIYDPRDETQLPVVIGEEGFMFTEVVSGDPRPRPPVILDGQNDFPLDPTLKDNAEAVLNIRSVYDFDGVASLDIATLANPALTPAAARPARWLRIEKPVSFPDEDTLDIDNTAFGISQANGMREILGYAEIAPDGSVLTKVPANVALSLTILDERGYRISPRHQNWISLRPGQELTCNGCHVPGQGVSHGRADAFDSAWAGAPSGVVEFPGTDSRWFINEVGDTMAETFAKASCDGSGPCDAIAPSVNVEYNDFWAADPTVAANNGYVSWRYTRTSPSSPDIPIAEGSNIATPSPTTTECENSWSALCRIVINYETIIHPIWQLSRPVTTIDPITGMEVPVLDAMGNPVDNMCVNCHSPTNPADGTVRVPAGQLELQDGQSPDEPDHFLSYRELLVGDNLQEVVGGVLVDAQQVIGQDVNGNDILAPIPINSPATIAGARFSGDFFDRFADPADTHFNLLSEAERRLIAEWLDIGGQYYNNPFDAPMN